VYTLYQLQGIYVKLYRLNKSIFFAINVYADYKNAKKTTLNVELKEHLTIQAFLTRNKQ